jgi:hypothetical protein
MDEILEAYDKMIKDHGGDEDICMIRLMVKHNFEALPTTRDSRPYEVVRDEKMKMKMKEEKKKKRTKQTLKQEDSDDPVTWWEKPKTRNEGRLPFSAEARLEAQLEELDPTIDPLSTTAGNQRKSSSPDAAAATSAAPAPTGIENDTESGSGGISGTVASVGTTEAASAQASSSNTEMREQGKQEATKKKSKHTKPQLTIGELLSITLSLETAEGAFDVLQKKKMWKSSKKALRDEVLIRGGLMAGIQALRAPLGWLIQRKACQFLIAISHEREDIKYSILNPDGLVLIVDAMNANIDSIEFQHAACNALIRLGIWELDQEKVLNIIATVMKVAEKYVTDAYICHFVCRMLEHVGKKSAYSAKIKKDIFDLAINVFMTHETNDELKAAECARSLTNSLMKG